MVLVEYAAGAEEAALTRAYELGRVAILEGIGVLELAAMHHEALASLGASGIVAPPIERLAQLLAESLSPFELTLRAYRANVRLLGLGESAGVADTAIDRAREQLQTMLDATTALIYMKGADNRYLFVNRQFQRVFGVSREQAIGKTDEQALPTAVAAVFRNDDVSVLQACQARELEETIPFDDGPHTYIALKFPLLDAAGAAYAVCCVATDITERKRADEALRQAKLAVEECNRELESFSYSVAHDLRAPLRSIEGFSQALEEDCADALDDDGKRYLRCVREAAQRMNRLIDDLLLLARVGVSDLEGERVDLSALARETFERLQCMEPRRRVIQNVQDGLVTRGDSRLLSIVLDNLLGNAWKFTAKRDQAVISFGRVEEPEGPALFVRDNGAGFDMAHAQKLFGVFQRLHSSKDFEGTGIGLATVQRVIRRHRGRIWATAVLEEGATFYFTLGDEV
jgi:PAS domain S-box-containing protein